jgi:hypothetical protein
MNLYNGPIEIKQTTAIRAYAEDEQGNKSFVTTSEFVKRDNDWGIQLNTAFEPQYAAGGPDGLIDGLRGTENWRMGNWQGYQLQPFEAVIDLKKIRDCQKVKVGFLQDTRAWIVMPKSLKIELSIDGRSFKEVYNNGPFLSIEDLTTQVKKLEALFEKQQARFIKIKAEQYGKLPNWHEGAGGDTHIFVDEIEVE